MRRKALIAAGVAAAAVATALAVPALAAQSDRAPAQPRAAAPPALLDATALRTQLERRIDAAVAGGWITPKLAAALEAQLAEVQRRLPDTRALEARLLEPAARALGTTPKQLRSELRSGRTLGEILAKHGKSPEALLRQLVERVDQRLGRAVGAGKLTEQRADTLLQRLEQRLGAWLARLLGS